MEVVVHAQPLVQEQVQQDFEKLQTKQSKRAEKAEKDEAKERKRSKKESMKPGVKPEQGMGTKTQPVDTPEPDSKPVRSPLRRSGPPIEATPRMKEFVKRRRLQVAKDVKADSPTPARGSKDPDPTSNLATSQDPKGGNTAPVAGKPGKLAPAQLDSVKQEVNWKLPKEVCKGMEWPAEMKKNFTVRKPGAEVPADAQAIRVNLQAGSFYVLQAKIPAGLEEAMRGRNMLTQVKLDSKSGCSLGWGRFRTVKEAWLGT